MGVAVFWFRLARIESFFTPVAGRHYDTFGMIIYV